MEQLTSNIDILKTIFNYLKLEEQIIATQVCLEFQYVIVNCMWRYKYRHIKVFKLHENTFIINTRSKHKADDGKSELFNEYFVDIEYKDFQNFLKLHQENLARLELYDYGNNDVIVEEKFCCKNDWRFPNLAVLILQFVKLDAKELNMILQNCKNLETLRMKQCLNSKLDVITLQDQDNMEYEILLKIVGMLKEFRIEYREIQFSDSALSLHDLLINNNLKYLNVNIPLWNLRYKEIPRLRNNSCEKLQIGNFSEFKILQKFTRLYLKSFQNLSSLTIEGSLNKILIETQFIQSLATSCSVLKYLNFIRCLMNVDDFGLLSTITEISLDNCMSLTWRNLKQLLELPQLQGFHTSNSTYTREIENIFISFNLKSLTFVGNEFRFAKIFSNPEKQLTNLKQLIYYDGSDDKIVGISRKFPNLEVLHILSHHIDVKDLYDLRSLKVFKVPKSLKNRGDLLSLMHLIKHPTLRQLSITCVRIDFSNQFSLDLSNVKFTKLSSLTIDFELFNYMFEFLMDLLSNNVKLKLIVISEDVANFQYYFDLVQNRKFLRDSIMLCGFQIDCRDFTAHPKSVERKLDLIKELSEFKNIYFVI